MSSLVAAARQVNWVDVISSDLSVDCQWNAFHSKLSDLIDIHIPKHFVFMSDRDKEWLTPLTKYLIQERWTAYRNRQWSKYAHLKKKVQQEIAHAKSLWAEKLKSTPRGLWKLVNSVQRRSGNSDPLSRLVSDYGDVSILLNELRDRLIPMFAKPQVNSVPRIDSIVHRNDWTIEISEHAVWKLLSKLDCSKAPGYDGIPNKVYRCLADIISLPLSIFSGHLFQNQKFQWHGREA